MLSVCLLSAPGLSEPYAVLHGVTVTSRVAVRIDSAPKALNQHS